MKKNAFFPIFNMFEDFVEKSSSDELKENHGKKSSCSIALDIIENDQQYLVIANLPGVSKENVKISYLRAQLIIEANMEENIESNEKVLRKERFCGLYYRTINLPDHIDHEKITAKMENGILKLVLPKMVEKKTNMITIE